MCGIVGIVATKDRGEIERVLRRMTDAIIHRGPDDSGAHIAPNLGLAMRRLSIIDLSGGRQPMHTADGVSIICNGEIYNYVALRRELIARGYSFKTKSDTEVILNLYHAFGVEAFKRLNGMFAVALHDNRIGELILARDPIGIKPLYYLVQPDKLLFASEIKAILSAMPEKPGIDAQAVWDFLSLRYVPPPGTIWRGILKLQPGHVLRYSLTTRQAQLIRFWNPDLTPEPFDPGRNYDREFEDQFMAAVQSHILASDVPVGLFLSGGLDSGAICAAAIELGQRDFHTFSVGSVFNGKDDETALARMVSDLFGTRHHEIVVSRESYFDQLDSVAYQFDEPYGDETGAAVLLLSQDACQHVKVVMSGDGADEMLLGYCNNSTFDSLAAVDRRYRNWPAGALNAASHLFGSRRSKILRAIAAGGAGAYFKGAASHIATTLKDSEKIAFWRGGPMRPTHALVSSWYTLPTDVHPLAQIQQADFQTWLVENILMKSDKMSMAKSLEQRVPFLHLPLVEWCQKSPMEVRIGNAEKGGLRSKAVLRNFVADRLPAEVLNAPKRGFPVPTLHWFGEVLREKGQFVAVSRAIRDWIDFDALGELVARGIGGERKALAKLWGVVMLDRWFKAYVD
jgi:asparagine synthase (glutamine-hydrolysing)